MSDPIISALEDRAFVRVSGKEAERLLQGLFTCEVESLPSDRLAFGALLTPQGKILFDFFLFREEGDQGGFIIDVDASQRDALIQRLGFYRLRADARIEPDESARRVFAAWGESVGGEAETLASESERNRIFSDPRLPEMGFRIYSSEPPSGELVGVDEYHVRRIGLGIPHGGVDFAFGSAFPHEALMDRLGGVDFEKGCYVGQEVVSRVRHRGKERKRAVMVESDSALPSAGTEILADGKPIGTLGGSRGNRGIAIARLDRIAEAEAKGSCFRIDGVEARLSAPSWADFG